MENISIRIAGNTEAPCYWAIIAKGFEVTMHCNITNEQGTDCIWTIEAEKDTCVFSATTIQELLGLIAMWEVRGNEWRVNEQERDKYFEDIRDKAPVYDFDGTIIDE